MVTTDLSAEEIKKQIAKLSEIQSWNHNFSLGTGIETKPGTQTSFGKNIVKLKRLQPLLEQIGLTGKTIIDVGCNEGFFSFFMAEAGANVIGIDIDKHRLSKAEFIKKVKNINNVDFQNISIYSEEFKDFKKVDLCLCLGFLHRIPDPFNAISMISEKTDIIIFEWKALKFGNHDDAFAYFSPKNIDYDDYYGTEYWIMSFTALERILKRLGFSYFFRVDEAYQNRAILVAGKYNHELFNREEIVKGRNKVRIFLSHTKRYLKTLIGIFDGRINA